MEHCIGNKGQCVPGMQYNEVMRCDGIDIPKPCHPTAFKAQVGAKTQKSEQ